MPSALRTPAPAPPHAAPLDLGAAGAALASDCSVAEIIGKLGRIGLRFEEAAALLGVSASYIARCDVPKTDLPSNGPGGKPITIILLEDFVPWVRKHRRRGG